MWSSFWGFTSKPVECIFIQIHCLCTIFFKYLLYFDSLAYLCTTRVISQLLVWDTYIPSSFHAVGFLQGRTALTASPGVGVLPAPAGNCCSARVLTALPPQALVFYGNNCLKLTGPHGAWEGQGRGGCRAWPTGLFLLLLRDHPDAVLWAPSGPRALLCSPTSACLRLCVPSDQIY